MEAIVDCCNTLSTINFQGWFGGSGSRGEDHAGRGARVFPASGDRSEDHKTGTSGSAVTDSPLHMQVSERTPLTPTLYEGSHEKQLGEKKELDGEWRTIINFALNPKQYDNEIRSLSTEKRTIAQHLSSWAKYKDGERYKKQFIKESRKKLLKPELPPQNSFYEMFSQDTKPANKKRRREEIEKVWIAVHEAFSDDNTQDTQHTTGSGKTRLRW